MGIIAVAQLVPAAIAAAPIARLTGRLDPLFGLAGGYLVIAGLTAATGVAIVVGAPALIVYVLAIAASTSTVIPRPLHGTVIPAIAEDARSLTAANGATAIGEGLGGLAGPLVAGAIMGLSSPGGALLVMAVVGVVAAGLVASVHRHPASAGEADETEDEDRPGGPVLDPATRTIAAVITAQTIAYGAVDVLLVLVAIGQLGMGEAGAGYLTAALGVGGVVGGLVTFTLAGRRRLSGALAAGAVAFAVTFSAIAFVATPAPAIGLLILAGGGLILIDIVARTLLQRTVAAAALTASFGIIEGAGNVGLAIGAFLVTPLVATVGIAGAVVTTAIFMPIVLVAVWRPLRSLDLGASVPVVEIAILRRSPLFAPLTAPALEALARRVDHVTVLAGQTIIVEGEPGDRWYTVVSGNVRVHRGETPLRELGPGDAFGEIALLHRVPRTASVTALTDTELLALDREPFLAAVSGTPEGGREAARVAATHLSHDETDGHHHGADPALGPEAGRPERAPRATGAGLRSTGSSTRPILWGPRGGHHGHDEEDPGARCPGGADRHRRWWRRSASGTPWTPATKRRMT